MHRKSSGKALVIALVLGLIILVGALFWTNRERLGSGPSAFLLADRIPSNAFLALIIDLEEQLRLGRLIRELRTAVEELDEPQRQKIVEFENDLGMPPEEWLAIFQGRGYLAFLPPLSDDDLPELIGIVGLRKADAFESWWEDLASRNEMVLEPITVQGVTTYSLDDELAFGFDQNWVYLASSQRSYQIVVEATRNPGSNSLDQHPLFLAGQRSLDSPGAGVVAFLNLQSVWSQLSQASLPHTDQKTFDSLSAVECLIGSIDLKKMQLDGLLKVAEHSGELSKKLRTPGSIGTSALNRFSSEISAMNSFDLEWTFNSLVAVGMLSPSSRAEVGMLPLGLTIYGNPWLALEGEVTAGGQIVESLFDPFQENFLEARHAGQRTACVSNLKNIGTALDMWSFDHGGGYPESLEGLIGPYLMAIPTCPAAGVDSYSAGYQRKTDPQRAGVYCSGEHHNDTEPNHPRYDTLSVIEVGALASAEQEPLNPSVVAIAPLKDTSKAHSLLSKLLDLDSTSEPAPGESRLYDLGEPDLSLRLDASDPPALILEVGPESGSLLDTSQGTLAARPIVKELMAWGGEGIVYFDYLDLQPLYSHLLESLKDSDSTEAKVAQKALSRFQRYSSSLEGASCVTVTQDGLRFRSKGLGNSGLIVGGSLSAAILVPNFIRARSQGQLTACKSNMKNIGTALEMWATDYLGQYPQDLEVLAPDYLRMIPDCPAAGFDTYSSGYSVSQNRDRFQFYCDGFHHQAAGLAPDRPSYDSQTGLQEF